MNSFPYLLNVKARSNLLNEKVRRIYAMDSSELRKNLTESNIDISLSEFKKNMLEGTPIYGFTPQIDTGHKMGLWSFVFTHTTLHLKIHVTLKCWKTLRPVFRIEIDSIVSSEVWCLTANADSIKLSENYYMCFLYILAYEAENIEKSFYEYKARFVKDEKIKEISKNSIEEWLKVILKEKYSYSIFQEENKVMLSVRMKKGIQLDIPIYYKRFREIIPNLIETIEKYDQLIENTSVKVLISNFKRYENWNK